MYSIKEISKSQAKRFLLLKSGLLGEYKYKGKEGILEFIKQAGCVQYDPIDICGKNHELVLQSRIKGFAKSQLFELLYKDRLLIDWFDKNMAICLTSDYHHFEDARIAARESSRSKKEIDLIADEIIEYIKANGPICSSDIKYNEKVSWGWAPTSLSRAALDTLYYRGDLIIHHKKNTRKYYDLSINHFNQELFARCKISSNRSLDDRLLWNITRRIGSVGMLHNNSSYAFIGTNGLNTKKRNIAYETLLDNGIINVVKVIGLEKPFYYKKEDEKIMEIATSDIEHKKRIEFIAPLDNVIWDRKLTAEIFDFEYKWEIYTPIIERKYGYYVLPILYGEDFVGRIELIRDKKNKTIIEKNIWIERDIDGFDINSIREKISEFSNIMYDKI